MGWGGLFCNRFGGGYGMGHMWGLGGGGNILGAIGAFLGLLFFLGLLALLVLGIVWMARRTRVTSTTTAGGPSLTSSPLDLARRRLATGEITKEEYRQIRDELRDS